MNIGDKKIIKIIKSLNELDIYPLSDESELKHSKFGMIILKTKEDNDYGKHNYFLINLCTNGEFKDIQIGKYQISHIIRCKQTFIRSRLIQWHNTIILKFHNEENNINEEIEIDTDATTESILLHIVYILILLSELNDFKRAKDTYILIFRSEFCLHSIGNTIEQHEGFRFIFPKIIEKYAFMKTPIIKGLHNRREYILNHFKREEFNWINKYE